MKVTKDEIDERASERRGSSQRAISRSIRSQERRPLVAEGRDASAALVDVA